MSALSAFEYVEFYVTCNPPLLPQGVANIVRRVQAELGHKVDEILYEPEVPWFKIRSASDHRNKIEKWMQDALSSIGEEDVSPCQFGLDNQGPEDVEVDEESQRVLPYVNYVAENAIQPSEFNNYRFPSFIGGPYREVWQFPVDNMEDVLESAKGKWFAPLVPSSMDTIGNFIQCEVSWDLEQTVLYVGSAHSMTRIREGIQQLEKIIGTIRLLSELRWTHSLVVHKPGQIRVGFKWLTHLDLAAKTFNFNIQPASDPTRGASTRLAREELPGEDQWVMTRTRYPAGQTFSSPPKGRDAFAQCGYRPKQGSPQTPLTLTIKEENPESSDFDPHVLDWVLGKTQAKPAVKRAGPTSVRAAGPASVRTAESARNEGQNIPKDIVTSLITPMKDMVELLRAVPGKVTLELQLGRLWFNHLAGHMVHSDGPGVSGELWRVDDLQSQLNSKPPLTGFQGVLTASRDDARRLVDIRAPNAPRWRDPDIIVTYEFYCRLNDSKFKVVVDAKTFSHEVIGLNEEIAGVNLHCPEHAWDMRILATLAHSGFETSYHQAAQILTQYLSVQPQGQEVALEVAAPPQTLLAIIDSAEIRHVARYKSKASNGRVLSITMTRPLARAIDLKQQNSFRGSTFATSNSGLGSGPGEYFEAAVSSQRAEEMLQQNLKLEFGDTANWNKDDFEAEGVFDDMCRPALNMVSQMDGIGSTNRNSSSTQLDSAPIQSHSEHYEF